MFQHKAMSFPFILRLSVFIVGVALLGLTAIGITSNAFVIILFTKCQGLKSRTSHLLRSLAVSDGVMAVVGGPVYLINAFNHRWIFYEKGNTATTLTGTIACFETLLFCS